MRNLLDIIKNPKSNSNLTEVIAIMDKSGSMISLKDDSIGGFNQFIEDQQNNPNDIRVTLTLFDTKFKTLYEEKSVHDPGIKLDKDNYRPSGMTALLDAIGYTLNSALERFKEKDTKDIPGKVIVVIITDGQENSSKTYQNDSIKDLINKLKKKGWEFVYLGANQDSFTEAGKIGVEMSFDYNASSIGTQALYSTISETVTAYSSSNGNTVWKDEVSSPEEWENKLKK